MTGFVTKLWCRVRGHHLYYDYPALQIRCTRCHYWENFGG
jgi:hypothetical protein